MGQKRGNDSKPQAVESKKRKKGSKLGLTSSDGAWDGSVDVDQLNWKEVALPDRMADVGGFFGLEEIDDVEIIRPNGKGEVQFKAKAGKPKNSILKDPSKEPVTHEEWDGFSNDESNEQPTTSDKSAEPEPARDSSFKAGLSFAALEDDADDDGMDVSAWDKLGLSPNVLTGLSKMKFSTPTTVQKSCIPAILEGHDVVGKASTGSGKTLAFGIPILEYYLEKRPTEEDSKEKKPSSPMALILSPTRELAHQLAKHIGDLRDNSPGLDARIALLTGGLSIQKQQRQLANADIVVGTPGRVWEILSSGQGLIRKMQRVQFLVVDEADRLLSEGHFKEVEEIIGALDRQEHNDFPDVEEEAAAEDDLSSRQTLVFSATFHRDLQQKLAGKGRWTTGDLMDKKESMEYLLKKLNFREEKPKFIDVNPVQQMAEGLKEGIVECPAMEKDLYLYSLLLYHPKHRTLVFTNSISAVRRLTQLLQTLQMPALALHSSMAQKARLRSVERFSSPKSDPSSILVATDVAARGLDIKGIDCVVHYHAPRTADAYVHRSGRTARAGAVGKSIIICAPDEVVSVARLAAKVHASNPNVSAKKLPLQSIDIDRRVVSRVRPRINLAKKITESNIAKEKVSAEENWLREAADDLGVDYDSEEFDESQGKGRGRGGGRHQREKKASSITKGELASLRAELKQLLSQRVNIGVSERYLTAGRVDIEALLRGEGNEAFLGNLDPLKF
ncbi:ATP-dependent RNA helicase mak5 [Penicillium chermesinum]|uniref:RNA helicase n=1 Tax=Penicillium chermesinum TaxID=63820 RepID=A0A9W9NWB2_9EURO|nr:ATP-dependent RNA helicase mak5 [Penicillium chermesinum]KAJ5226118.1 ATP-dependent RNA helicase mak5 [Penicillium chermesinum]